MEFTLRPKLTLDKAPLSYSSANQILLSSPLFPLNVLANHSASFLASYPSNTSSEKLCSESSAHVIKEDLNDVILD